MLVFYFLQEAIHPYNMWTDLLVDMKYVQKTLHVSSQHARVAAGTLEDKSRTSGSDSCLMNRHLKYVVFAIQQTKIILCSPVNIIQFFYVRVCPDGK